MQLHFLGSARPTSCVHPFILACRHTGAYRQPTYQQTSHFWQMQLRLYPEALRYNKCGVCDEWHMPVSGSYTAAVLRRLATINSSCIQSCVDIYGWHLSKPLDGRLSCKSEDDSKFVTHNTFNTLGVCTARDVWTRKDVLTHWLWVTTHLWLQSITHTCYMRWWLQYIAQQSCMMTEQQLAMQYKACSALTCEQIQVNWDRKHKWSETDRTTGLKHTQT